MAKFKLKRLISGGLIANYFCTSRCRHCLYNAGPHWEQQYIDPSTTEANLRVVRSLGCSSVHIGGGEPLLRPAELEKVLDVAARVGVFIEYVETNSSWFKDTESAIQILARLRHQGLRTLLVSISPFHNEFIPFSKVKGVMEAARRAGIEIFPWIADFIRDLSEFDPDQSHDPSEYQQRFGRDYLIRVLQRYWVHLGGRALDTFRPLFETKSFEQILNENPGNCRTELSETSHFHIDLFGNYIPGLCSGLAISRDDLGKPLAPEKYPLLTTLFQSGIRGLAQMAQHEFGYSPRRDDYINKCDVCNEIRNFLVHGDQLTAPDLQPAEFYMQKTS
ncbi:MAG: radical SAM protein [Deltaproteobacteria bacterium]|nr:radical SAM protein [Deltaproteobacteria bacterium]